MPSQNLPAIKADSRVVVGSLPDGITYHLVTDPSLKGLADIALVQRGINDVTSARTNLYELPAFGKQAPYLFLSRNGIGCRENGYVKYNGNSTIYSFESVQTTKAAVMDSTLLLVFKLAETFPGDQDIIVAGDITSKTVQDRLSVLSMLVSKRGGQKDPDSYTWNQVDTMTYRYSHRPSRSDVRVSAIYRSARPPRESMNTAQPVVTSKFTHELGLILKNRISRELYKRSIPNSGVSFYKRTSEDGPSDELYGISVYTDTAYTSAATSVIAATLASLDEKGATIEEYEDAKRNLYSNASEFAKNAGDGNQAHVNRCIASYLYGSSLASPETIASMFASKDMDSAQELQLFNSFVGALLDKDANLLLSCSSPSYSDSLEVIKTFNISWIDHRRIVSQSSGRINAADTLGLVTSASKTKVKTTSSDYITGGSLWTFSNGMRVVYKQTAANKGHFSYGLFVRGGYAGIEGLDREDEKYIADLISLYDVGGLQEYNFTRMLDANGIVMQSKVTPSGLALYGKAPSSSLNLLMKSILSISSERELNRSAFDYYVKSKGLSDKNLLTKDYQFQDLVEKYYADKLSNFADAELVIVGDIPEGVAKKILSKFMGGFNQQKSNLPRKVMTEVVSSGTTTQMLDLSDMPERTLPSVNVTMTTAVPFTTDRLMSLYVAGSCLEKALSKELSAVGVFSKVEASYALTPSESFTFDIICHPADESGLPLGIVPPDPVDVLSSVRKIISEVSSKPLSKSDLDAHKQLLLNRMEPQVKNPDTIVEAARVRFLDGKDILSEYTNKIKSVSSDSVQKVLSDLSTGCVEEVVVR